MSESTDHETAGQPGTEPGTVREEAERLVAAVLARFAATRAATGNAETAEYDPERASRLAHAVGDVAVAVTGLLRELARTPEGESARQGLNLREGFALLAGQVVEAAGIDLHADPERADGKPWTPPEDSDRPGAHPGAAPPGERVSAHTEEDPWRAATRASQPEQEPR